MRGRTALPHGDRSRPAGGAGLPSRPLRAAGPRGTPDRRPLPGDRAGPAAAHRARGLAHAGVRPPDLVPTASAPLGAGPEPTEQAAASAFSFREIGRAPGRERVCPYA